MFINIEIERLRRRMTRKEMAYRLDVSQEVLNNWIQGRRAIPAAKLREMWHLFDYVSIDYLLRKE